MGLGAGGAARTIGGGSGILVGTAQADRSWLVWEGGMAMGGKEM